MTGVQTCALPIYATGTAAAGAEVLDATGTTAAGARVVFATGTTAVGAGVVGATAAGVEGAMVAVVVVSDIAQVSVRPPSIHVALPRLNVVLVDTTSG